MTESLEELARLTKNIFKKDVKLTDITDKDGAKIIVIQTVDDKLVEAKSLIADAQAAAKALVDDAIHELTHGAARMRHDADVATKMAGDKAQAATVQAQIVADDAFRKAEIAATIINNGKDKRILQLVESLKQSIADLASANGEIARLKDR
jgi:uncharacterized protein involved in exopolysaccharide biosynthesis